MSRRLMLGGTLCAALFVTGCGDSNDPTPAGSPPAAVLSGSRLVSPRAGDRHQRFTVTITTRRATGVRGRTRRSYFAEAHALRPASGCVNDRDRGFPAAPGERRVRAVLDPARGEGGPEGWCPGTFAGTITYSQAFACPASGVCHPPPRFPARHCVVSRFSFHVR